MACVHRAGSLSRIASRAALVAALGFPFPSLAAEVQDAAAPAPAPSSPAPSIDHVTVSLIGDRPLSLRVRDPLGEENPLSLQNEPNGSQYISKVRLLRDRRYTYIVFGEGAPDAGFRAPTQEGSEILVFPGSTRMRKGGIALMVIGGVPVVVGAGLLVASALGALVIVTVGGNPSSAASTSTNPYLLPGALSVVGGAILVGIGGAMLGSSRTIIKLPPEEPPRVTLLPGRLWLSGRGLVF